MKVFTTGQVAKICKVKPRTVSRWFDSGRLKGYRIPGSEDRRIPKEYLIKFLKEYNMPVGDLEDDMLVRVLVVTQDQVLIEDLQRDFMKGRPFKVIITAGAFDAGFEAVSLRPECVIVDLAIGRTEALQICKSLRQKSALTDAILIALLPDDGITPRLEDLNINETYRKPFDVALLAERLLTEIGGKKELA